MNFPAGAQLPAPPGLCTASAPHRQLGTDTLRPSVTAPLGTSWWGPQLQAPALGVSPQAAAAVPPCSNASVVVWSPRGSCMGEQEHGAGRGAERGWKRVEKEKAASLGNVGGCAGGTQMSEADNCLSPALQCRAWGRWDSEPIKTNGWKVPAGAVPSAEAAAPGWAGLGAPDLTQAAAGAGEPSARVSRARCC